MSLLHLMALCCVCKWDRKAKQKLQDTDREAGRRNENKERERKNREREEEGNNRNHLCITYSMSSRDIFGNSVHCVHTKVDIFWNVTWPQHTYSLYHSSPHVITTMFLWWHESTECVCFCFIYLFKMKAGQVWHLKEIHVNISSEGVSIDCIT